MPQTVLLVLLGLLAGILSGLIGIGGGVVIVRRHPRHRIFVERAHQPGIGAHGADDFHAGRCLNHVWTLVRVFLFLPTGLGRTQTPEIGLRYGEALRCGCSSSRT